jgi:hypothetical protein
MALRVVLVLVALHAGRITHAVSDLLVGFDVVSVEEASDCDSNGDDDGDCPPGCPNCHCLHCGISSLPARVLGPVLEHAPRTTAIADVPYEADAPRAPPIDSPFRPPRTAQAA